MSAAREARSKSARRVSARDDRRVSTAAAQWYAVATAALGLRLFFLYQFADTPFYTEHVSDSKIYLALAEAILDIQERKLKIQSGETIELKSTLDEKRTFKLKIKEFVPNQRLVWGDPMGSRVYSLEKAGKGTQFTMSEKIGGPLFPLFASMIPSFDESFDRFAADLKKEAETIQRSKN